MLRAVSVDIHERQAARKAVAHHLSVRGGFAKSV
jgi:hypothetical protein